MANFYNKTGNDVATYVKRQFGDESGVQIDDPDIIQWINISQLELAQDNEFSKLVATRNIEEGVGKYQFPDLEILYTQSIYVDSEPVRYYSFQEFQEYIQKNKSYTKEVANTPRIWTEWGGTFTLWPTPSRSIENGMEIYLVVKPKDITSLSELLSIPDRLYSVLLKQVMVHAYMLDEQFDAASLQDQRVQNEIGKLTDMPDKTSINEYSSMTILEDF